MYEFDISDFIMFYVDPLIYSITNKTHNSESRGQEQAGHMRQMSELFTGSTALKLVNALNKLPLKLSFSYQGLTMF